MAATAGKGQKFLRLALVLVPAVIFITYYLSGLHNRPQASPPVQPPTMTVNTGTPVNLGDHSFRAGSPAPVFTRTISEPGNTILAAPNQTFVIIPVIILQHDEPARPPGLTWQLVDDAGVAHPPVQPKNLLVPPAVTVPQTLNPVYLVFALPANSRQPFLLLLSPWGQAAWRLNRPAG
ncbi:MAG TPA: hypothetical protein VMW83_02605 [Spirochaetia bacterium]|nr:hypothetical protein [Spirochaetia bacterium]